MGVSLFEVVHRLESQVPRGLPFRHGHCISSPCRLEVHMRLHKLVGVEKGSGDGSSEGPIRIVARQIFDESRVLCLDEVEGIDDAFHLVFLCPNSCSAAR